VNVASSPSPNISLEFDLAMEEYSKRKRRFGGV